MINPAALINDIIRDLDVEEIDPQYIIEAEIVDERGNKTYLKGQELQDFLTGPDRRLRSARLKLDTDRLRHAMYVKISEMFKLIDHKKQLS
jgi:hypothetical protein